MATLVIIIQILTGIVGITAIGAFIYAGIVYSAASGNAHMVAKSKEIMMNTVIGLALFAGMAVLLNWLIPGGIFSGNATFGAGGNGESGKYTGTGSGNGNQKGSNPTDVDGTAAANFIIATYNIRATELTAWDSTRANAIFSYLKSVDISGIQEGRERSINWLTPKMKSAGYSRTNNQWARQVFWNNTQFTLVKQGEKQLGNPVKDLVWVKLKEKQSGKQFYFATIHLGVSSSSERTAELRIALSYMNSIMTDAPIIFVGDMNSAIGSSQDKQIKGAGFQDSYAVARTKKNVTYRTTLQGFTGGITGKIDMDSNHQIDHIYIKGNLVVQRMEIKNQRGSDHLSVEAAISIPSG